MAAAKTWIWIILGFIAVCLLSLFLIAGVGVYFVSHHIVMQKTTSSDAMRAFDLARATFKAQQPLLEIDPLEHPRETRSTADLPTSAVTPTNLYILAWNPEEDRLARVTLPFWLMRLGHRKMNFLDSDQGFNFSRLNLDVVELERIGPALVLDFRPPSGEQVLIWTQ